MDQANAPQEIDSRPLDPLERQVISVFVDGVRVLGMPRSIGEIYGLLFISQQPLSLDDLVERLQISKGSASQGLRTLKGLGAVKETSQNSERRTYYEPAVELKRLVGGFIREQVKPHLESGKAKISDVVANAKKVEDRERREFLEDRLRRLQHWMTRGGRVMPILQTFLGQ